MPVPRTANAPTRPAAAPRCLRCALALLAIAVHALAIGAAPAAPDPIPATHYQQARETERVLQELNGNGLPGPSINRETTSASLAPTSSQAPTSFPTYNPAALQRPTSGTLVLRPIRSLQARLALLPGLALSTATQAFDSATSTDFAGVPDLLAGLRAKITTVITSATVFGPRIDPAWLSARPAIVPKKTALGVVHVNAADTDELREKLKLDPIRARYIVEFRTLYGRFKGPADLNQVSGITDEMILKWEEKCQLDFN